MQLQPMRAEHLEQVRALARQLGYDMPLADLAGQYGRVAGRADHWLAVAVEGDRVLGWVHAFGTEVLYDEPFVDVGALVVDESLRRHGLGTVLLRAVEAWAREAGYAQVRIRSRLSREGAHRFYVRLGYTKEKAQYTFVLRP